MILFYICFHGILILKLIAVTHVVTLMVCWHLFDWHLLHCTVIPYKGSGQICVVYYHNPKVLHSASHVAFLN